MGGRGGGDTLSVICPQGGKYAGGIRCDTDPWKVLVAMKYFLGGL